MRTNKQTQAHTQTLIQCCSSDGCVSTGGVTDGGCSVSIRRRVIIILMTAVFSLLMASEASKAASEVSESSARRWPACGCIQVSRNGQWHLENPQVTNEDNTDLRQSAAQALLINVMFRQQ